MFKYTICIILLIQVLYFPLYSQSLNSSGKSLQNSLNNKNDSVWSGFVSLEGTYQGGNSNKSILIGKGKLDRTDEKLQSILITSYLYGTKNNIKDNNNLTSMLTIDYNYKKSLSPFFLQIFEYDFAKGIDARSQTGGGTKYLLLKNSNNKISASLALIFDYTNLADKPGNYDTDRMRFSLRLKTENAILDSHLIFSAVAFYQPAVNNFSENNQRYDLKLSLPIVKRFKFITNYLYSKDDVVSVGRKRVDIMLTFGLEYSFGF